MMAIILLAVLCLDLASALLGSRLPISNKRYVGENSLFAAAPTLSSPQPTPPIIPIRSLEHQWKILPDIWATLAKTIPEETMLVDVIREPNQSISYGAAHRIITTAAAAFQKLGLLAGDCVSLFSENSYKWFLVDQAIMKAGGCNAVRGASAPVSELRYIYENAGSVGLVVENAALLAKLYDTQQQQEDGLRSGGGLRSQSGAPKFIVVLYAEGASGEELRRAAGDGMVSRDTAVLSYEELLEYAREAEYRGVMRDSESTATVVYTSGTTSRPKGVLLRHRNILHQVTSNSFSLDFLSPANPAVRDVFLSILPCWHIFERTAEYYMLSRGCRLVYSNLRNFKTDLSRCRPHYLVVVPRLIETLQKGVLANIRAQSAGKRRVAALVTRVSGAFKAAYRTFANALVSPAPASPLRRLLAALKALLLWPLYKLGDLLLWKKVRANLGGRLKVVVSGGSLLPMAAEQFFDMLGVPVIVGYGLTETSPTITSRYIERNVLGSVGSPTPRTTIRIVDPATRLPVRAGEAGLVLAKGPSVMAGYIRNEAATKEAVDAEGFFDTGDLGRLNHSGDIVITGRAKDTIVLSNGENVAPEPIEQALVAQIPLVDQAVLVGQDQRFLSALLVLSVPELVRRGLLSEERGRELSAAIGMTPALGVAGDEALLRREEAALQADPAVQAAVREAVEQACAGLRSWERVAAFHTLLVPLSVPSGLMTQTLKIKRPSVAQYYAGAIQALYNSRGRPAVVGV